MVLVFQVVDPEGSQAEEAQRVARHQKREHRRVSILDWSYILLMFLVSEVDKGESHCTIVKCGRNIQYQTLIIELPLSAHLCSPVNTLWRMTMRPFLTTTSAPGSWATSTGCRLRPSSGGRGTEHSWFETAARQGATPAVLCTYKDLVLILLPHPELTWPALVTDIIYLRSTANTVHRPFRYRCSVFPWRLGLCCFTQFLFTSTCIPAICFYTVQ